eukprot:384304-Amphidinium_carterae.1
MEELALADAANSWYGYLSLSHHYLTRPARARVPSDDCHGAEALLLTVIVLVGAWGACKVLPRSSSRICGWLC